MPHSSCIDAFDLDFKGVEGLVWLPWVGRNFATRSPRKRLLVVGESHYVKPPQPDQLALFVQQHLDYPDYTRDVVSDCLIDQDWPNRTLDTLPKLLFQTQDIDRSRLWSDAAFYNFVQTPMHYNREGSHERPNAEAFISGWKVFADVVRILCPSHCLFIGVAASNSFNYAINGLSLKFREVQWSEPVGRTYPRVASLESGDQWVELVFVKHLGKYFSASKWHQYLRSNHSDLLGFLDEEAYPLEASVS